MHWLRRIRFVPVERLMPAGRNDLFLQPDTKPGLRPVSFAWSAGEGPKPDAGRYRNLLCPFKLPARPARPAAHTPGILRAVPRRQWKMEYLMM